MQLLVEVCLRDILNARLRQRFSPTLPIYILSKSYEWKICISTHTFGLAYKRHDNTLLTYIHI